MPPFLLLQDWASRWGQQQSSSGPFCRGAAWGWVLLFLPCVCFLLLLLWLLLRGFLSVGLSVPVCPPVLLSQGSVQLLSLSFLQHISDRHHLLFPGSCHSIFIVSGTEGCSSQSAGAARCRFLECLCFCHSEQHPWSRPPIVCSSVPLSTHFVLSFGSWVRLLTC